MKYKLLASTAFAAALAAASPASATLTIESGTFGGGAQGQVLFDTAVSGSILLADLNAGPQNVIRFTSSTDNLTADASGQAVIMAGTGLLNQLTITTVSPFIGFEAFTFNVNAATGTSFTVSAEDQLAGTPTFSQTFTAGPGQNQVRILSDSAQFITSVSLSSGGNTPLTVGVSDARQFRLNTLLVPGPIAGAGLPVLMALGGLVVARRRKAAATA